MINEPIHIKDNYYELSEVIYAEIQKRNILKKDKLVIGICGESGSGKTVTATCLKETLKKYEIKTKILHMDSFYLFPPSDNHQKRKKNISWVGPQEVDLQKLNKCILEFKNNVPKISIPVVDYKNNLFNKIEISLENVQVIIIEGVYTFHLSNLDFNVFLEATFKDTLQVRKNRTREVYDAFVEQVLEIEHQLVIAQKTNADLLISKNYKVK